MDKNCIDLLTLQTLIKSGLDAVLPDNVWVKGEIASISVRRGGHCYMELSQSRGGNVVAQIKAIVWSSIYGQLSGFFHSVTGTDMEVGQQVLLCARVQYSALYGLSLIVEDIDPSYTLGDAERKRIETLERLSSEGLLERQKELAVPALPFRIAVVSAENAAGYRDFMRHLHENEYGFAFSTDLYESPMQGADCPSGVADALARIEASGVSYDAVAVLRGGGGKLDLACFDDYVLCAAIARHPNPVLTAIGHDQDTHLCDMVACEAVKTPTALADWFIGLYMDEDARLEDLRHRLKNARRNALTLMEGTLEVLRTRLEAASPRRVLKMGYMLAATADGQIVKSAAGLEKGGKVVLLIADGRADCHVDEIMLDKE